VHIPSIQSLALMRSAIINSRLQYCQAHEHLANGARLAVDVVGA